MKEQRNGSYETELRAGTERRRGILSENMPGLPAACHSPVFFSFLSLCSMRSMVLYNKLPSFTLFFLGCIKLQSCDFWRQQILDNEFSMQRASWPEKHPRVLSYLTLRHKKIKPTSRASSSQPPVLISDQPWQHLFSARWFG